MNVVQLIGLLVLVVAFLFAVVATVFYLIIIQHKGHKDEPRNKRTHESRFKDKEWM